MRFPARRRYHPAPTPPAATLVVVAVLALSFLLPAVLAPRAAASSLPRHAARDKDDHPQETPPVDLPRVALDLAEPQWIAIGLVACGAIGLLIFRGQPEAQAGQQR